VQALTKNTITLNLCSLLVRKDAFETYFGAKNIGLIIRRPRHA
jgi:hypothetical protein